MLRTSDLVRIVVRRQMRQLRIGVILSISIGIAMFIGVDVVGKDIEERVSQDVTLIGTVTIILATFDDFMHPDYPPQTFTTKTVQAVRALPEVLHASRCMRWAQQVSMMVGTKSVTLRVQGVDSEFWKVYSIEPLEGRLLNDDDDRARSRVCVLGEEMARRLFGKPPYVGRSLTIFNDNYTVVGVAGGVLMRNRADRCFLPLTTALDRLVMGDTLRANRLVIRTAQLEDMGPVLEKLPGIIDAQQKLPPNIIEYEHAKAELVKVTSIIDRVNIILTLGMIAALGLGCFGIWQSSFASVRERTQEIGLQLAMGAEQNDIMKQFLGESLFNALLGGAGWHCLWACRRYQPLHTF
ncbi:ABC transporter permease [Desulfovibrio sp. OttesenSCG-928-M14]|nr:ABC transporter permease [Desulfovibrio sp. OttesenSCG-928-M14]